MSTKPFRDIEQMMKAAAEGHEQPFDEAAWQKMEVLLDGDKDRRRPVFWWWWLLPVFVGVGIGGYFIFNKGDQPAGVGKSSESRNINVESTSSSNDAAPNEEEFASAVIPSKAEPNAVLPAPAQKRNHNHAAKMNTQGLPDANPPGTYHPPSGGRAKSFIAGKSNARFQVRTGENVPAEDLDKRPATDIDKISPRTPDPEPITSVDIVQSAEPQKQEKEIGVLSNDDPIPSVDKNPGKKNTANDKPSRWYFLVAGGAEGSSPRIFSVDKISARGGVAIGYQLNKNFSLQTGFFAGSKKYVAGPKDYKAKAGTYWSTVEIIEVDANCMVYEIPLNLRYDLLPGKTTNFFMSAGLSSYIMKKEDYYYSYNRYGYPHYGEAGYKGNNHLLSVLRLSAGIERKLSKRLSLIAAPALAIPLGGVGEGQVKLYSSEITFGLKYQPLKKSKDK